MDAEFCDNLANKLEDLGQGDAAEKAANAFQTTRADTEALPECIAQTFVVISEEVQYEYKHMFILSF